MVRLVTESDTCVLSVSELTLNPDAQEMEESGTNGSQFSPIHATAGHLNQSQGGMCI